MQCVLLCVGCLTLIYVKKNGVDHWCLKVRRLVSWCLKPSQPLWIISRLKKIFIKKYIAERTYEAEIRPGEQSEKRRVIERIYGMKYSWKGHKDRKRHKSRIRRSGQERLVYVQNINRNIPTTWRWARGDFRLKRSNDNLYAVLRTL